MAKIYVQDCIWNYINAEFLHTGGQMKSLFTIFERKLYILKFEPKYLDKITFSATIMTFSVKEILCTFKKPDFSGKILLYGTFFSWNKEKGYFLVKKGQIRYVRFCNFLEIAILYYLDTIPDIIFWPICGISSSFQIWTWLWSFQFLPKTFTRQNSIK